MNSELLNGTKHHYTNIKPGSVLRKNLISIIEQQNVDFSFEVIVVDNGSSDETPAVCKEAGGQIQNFIYCFDDEPGLLTGRHKGVSLSKGKVLSFIDDDVELNPQWIHTIVHHFMANPGISMIGGPCLPKYETYPPQWLKYFWQPTPYGGKMCLPLSLIDAEVNLIKIDPLYVFGLNYSIKKEAVIKLGGFHPDCIPVHLQKYQGDGETGLSIKAGIEKHKAFYVSAAFVYHQVSAERLTPEYFEKWHYYDGVCQSFSDIRKKYHLYKFHEPSIPVSMHLLKRMQKKLISVLSASTNDLHATLPPEILQLKARFSKKYHEGYQFHQHNFHTDERVKEWVLKPDYWNYELPYNSANSLDVKKII